MKRSPELRPSPEPKREKEKSSLEVALDLRLEECLIKYCQKINSGNNGVIFRLDVREAPEEIQEDLRELGVETEQERVLKLLKVYQSGVGQREFQMQARAYKTLEDVPGAAKIPKPYLHRDIELSEMTKHYLHESQMTKGVLERADLLVMEYIPGTDLGTILFREALQRASPEQYPDVEMLAGRDWQDVARELGPILDFRSPGGKSANESERQHEARKVETENVQKLMKHLKKTGFVLHPAILEQTTLALDTLHHANLAHRDVHERNIVVTGQYEYSPDAPPPQAYLIDFGTATSFSGNYTSGREDIFTLDTMGVRYLDDENIGRRYAPLAETKEMTKARIQKEGSLEISRKIASATQSPDFSRTRNAWVEYFSNKKADQKGALDALYSKMLAGKSGEERIFRFMGVIDSLVQNGLVDGEMAKKYLIKTDPSTYQKNVIASWIPGG